MMYCKYPTLRRQNATLLCWTSTPTLHPLYPRLLHPLARPSGGCPPWPAYAAVPAGRLVSPCRCLPLGKLCMPPAKLVWMPISARCTANSGLGECPGHIPTLFSPAWSGGAGNSCCHWRPRFLYSRGQEQAQVQAVVGSCRKKCCNLPNHGPETSLDETFPKTFLYDWTAVAFYIIFCVLVHPSVKRPPARLCCLGGGGAAPAGGAAPPPPPHDVHSSTNCFLLESHTHAHAGASR